MNANLQQQTSTRTGGASAQNPGWLLWGLPAQLGVAAEQGSGSSSNPTRGRIFGPRRARARRAGTRRSAWFLVS